MIVADEKGCRTMELRPAKHGIWEGQWLDHEKMPVLLVPWRCKFWVTGITSVGRRLR